MDVDKSAIATPRREQTRERARESARAALHEQSSHHTMMLTGWATTKKKNGFSGLALSGSTTE